MRRTANTPPPLTALQVLVQATAPPPDAVLDARRDFLDQRDSDFAARVLLSAYGRLLLHLCRTWAPSVGAEEAQSVAILAAMQVFADAEMPMEHEAFVSRLSNRVTTALRSEAHASLSQLTMAGRAARGAGRVKRAARQVEVTPGGLTTGEMVALAMPDFSLEQVEALRQAVTPHVPLDATVAMVGSEDTPTATRSAADEQIHAALATLSPSDAQVLKAFYGLCGHIQYSSEDLATMFDVPLATMQRRLGRARARLTEALTAIREAAVPVGASCRLVPTDAVAVCRAEKNKRFPQDAQRLAEAIVDLAHDRSWTVDQAVAVVSRVEALRQRETSETFMLDVAERVRRLMDPPARSAEPLVLSYGAQVEFFTASSREDAEALAPAFL